MADHVSRYAVRLTRATRREKGEVPDFIRDYVSWGAGPRASQYLVLAAKARAVLYGRYYVSTDDIRAVAGPVLRGTGSSPTSTPRPKGSSPTTSSPG